MEKQKLSFSALWKDALSIQNRELLIQWSALLALDLIAAPVLPALAFPIGEYAVFRISLALHERSLIKK